MIKHFLIFDDERVGQAIALTSMKELARRSGHPYTTLRSSALRRGWDSNTVKMLNDVARAAEDILKERPGWRAWVGAMRERHQV